MSNSMQDFDKNEKMKNTETKRNNINIFMVVMIITLIIWNVFLTNKVLTKKPVSPGNPTEVNQTIQNASYVTTDLTKTAESGIQKAVGIQTQNGSGSGAIFKSEQDGDKTIVTIITNYHVVTTEQTVNVLFANGQVLEGEVIGGDVFTDLAVVKVVSDFAVEAFSVGDSSTLKSGEWVLAIGSPLGLEFSGTVTEGIISGKDRTIGVDLNKDGVDDWDMQVLQTSAAINPGNSGGPLVNLSGELIGINSMKIAKNNVEGMGFAIPINEAIPIVEQLIETGTVKRPLIGLSGRDLANYSTAHKSYLGLPLDVESGVVVINVIKNGAADKVGIQPGDIITKVNDTEITQFKNFRMELYKHTSGDAINLEIVRGNETMKVTVELE